MGNELIAGTETVAGNVLLDVGDIGDVTEVAGGAVSLRVAPSLLAADLEGPSNAVTTS